MAEILALVINLFQFKDILDLKYTGIYFNIIIRCTLILRLTFEGEKCVLYIHIYSCYILHSLQSQFNTDISLIYHTFCLFDHLIDDNGSPYLNRHEAERLEQGAKGRLERQKISDEAEAEKARKNLLELQANSAAVESTGQAKAEAQSRAEASRIEGEAAVEQAKLKVRLKLWLYKISCFVRLKSMASTQQSMY